jgi:hypothetical protein
MATGGTRQALEDLARVIEKHAAGHGPATHTRVLDLCAEAVAFAREGRPSEMRVRARSAAHLLLDLVCPQLGADAVGEVAAACERAAVRLA